MAGGGGSAVSAAPLAEAANADRHEVPRTPWILAVVEEGGRSALLAERLVLGLGDAIRCYGAAPGAFAEDVEDLPGDEMIVQEGVLTDVHGIMRERRKGGRSPVIWEAQIGRGVSPLGQRR